MWPSIETTIVNEMPALYKPGRGEPVCLIPGLNDALRSVHQLPRFNAWFYHLDFTDRPVYVISRSRDLPPDIDTEKMANEYIKAIETIGADSIIGISLGGMIGQYVAAGSDQLDTAIIVSSAYRLGESGSSIVRQWQRYAKESDWRAFYRNGVATSFSGLYRHVFRSTAWLPGMIKEPTYAHDVVRSCMAALDHDGTTIIDDIDIPTYFLGGAEDPIFPPSLIDETASMLTSGHSTIIENAGHNMFTEDTDCREQIAMYLE